MELIKDQEFGGERPLYCKHDILLDNVTIHVGESSIKECYNVEAVNCQFEGKYPFWENNGFVVRNCVFKEGARSALWYSRNCEMYDSLVEAPKMFRSMDGIKLQNVRFPNAQETMWHVKNVHLEDVEFSNANYLFMDSENIFINHMTLNGNYSFQYCKNVEIHNSVLNSKDAFWETENVTIYDSIINGEFLAWYAKRLRLVNCHIKETQPLCYIEDLTMENCTMDVDCDLAFEYSSCQVDINGPVTSIKNPRSGVIKVKSVGEIILDENIKKPGNCKIIVGDQEV